MLKFMSISTNYLKTSAPTLLSNKADLFAQQTRNTVILKRMYPPGLHKKHSKPHKLKSRHFVYELVENTNSKKRDDIKVIMMKDVPKFGEVGDLISVSCMKGYNDLILPKLAVYASPENIEKYCLKDLSNAPRTMSVASLAEKYLTTLDLAVRMSKDNEWTIEKKHIRISCRKMGVHVPEERITMPSKPISGPNLDLEGKVFYVTVKINETTSVNVKCRVLHYSNDSADRQTLKTLKYWELPSIAIFSEDQEVIDKMPVHKAVARQLKASTQPELT